MNIPQIKLYLNKGVKHWAHHGLRHFDNENIVKECFHKIWMYVDKILEELDNSIPPPIPPEPPELPKLTIKNGVLSYGSQKKFFGASLREAITNSESEGDGWEHPTLSNREVFDWYQGELAKYPFNLARHNIGKDFALLENHCEEIERQQKVLILTMADLDSDGMGDWREAFERTKRFNNILYNAYNEFTDRGLNIAVGITDYIQDRGGLVSCGAWTGQKGEELSEEYLERCTPDVLSHHRPWDFNYMKELVDDGWIVMWDEFFRLAPEEVEISMKSAENIGITGINYYPFRESFVGSDDYKNYFEIAGNLCKEFNE